MHFILGMDAIFRSRRQKKTPPVMKVMKPPIIMSFSHSFHSLLLSLLSNRLASVAFFNPTQQF